MVIMVECEGSPECGKSPPPPHPPTHCHNIMFTFQMFSILKFQSKHSTHFSCGHINFLHARPLRNQSPFVNRDPDDLAWHDRHNLNRIKQPCRTGLAKSGPCLYDAELISVFLSTNINIIHNNAYYVFVPLKVSEGVAPSTV